jgi:signal transduction histidine kinase
MHKFIHSMRGQLFILLTLGIIVSSATSFWLAHRTQQNMLIDARAHHLAEDIGGFIDTLETAPSANREELLLNTHPIGIHGQLGEMVIKRTDFPIDLPLQEALQSKLGNHYSPFVSTDDPIHCIRYRKIDSTQKLSCQLVLLQLLDGTPVQLSVRKPPLLATPVGPGWIAPILFISFIALLAFLAARIATRPLQQLADAADQLNLSNEDPPLIEQGSSEVRTAIRAFNQMRQRISDNFHERTVMLAAITHDLQTPLTRLRLRLEKVSDEELRNKLITDMTAMQSMLQEGLDFARSLDSSEQAQEVDLESLLDSLCSDASDAGQDVRFIERSPAQARVHAMALGRALSNLIDNAVKYGQRAEVSLHCTATECHISIRDFGGGMPDSELEKVFTPFFRLEPSRSRTTGGSGLGLAIARNILRQHGGNVALINHPHGGLVAKVSLPFNHHFQGAVCL